MKCNAPGDGVRRTFDLMYVEGPGDLVESLRCWRDGHDLVTETSRTFSGQVFDCARANGLSFYALSYHPEPRRADSRDGLAENRPKLFRGIGVLHPLSQVLYGLRILAAVLRYRPRFLIVTSGVTYWWVLAPVAMLKVKFVACFHNCLWPSGYRPRGLLAAVKRTMDGWFFRRIATALVCVSPEIERQVKEVAGSDLPGTFQYRAQFRRCDFAQAAPLPAHSTRPFRIAFAGRIERNKGVFDILDMAESLRGDGVVFEICGGGNDLSELNSECSRRAIQDIVAIHGKLCRPDLLAVYARSHAVIVPTRSDFCEGMPMAAAEAILLGRPVLTSRLSNALDVLCGAIVEAKPNQVTTYVSAVRQLLADESYYTSLCRGCQDVREQFLDGVHGLTAVLQRALGLPLLAESDDVAAVESQEQELRRAALSTSDSALRRQQPGRLGNDWR